MKTVPVDFLVLDSVLQPRNCQFYRGLTSWCHTHKEKG